MTEFHLPALRSDDPVGFLAALGVVEVCAGSLGLPVRLGWEGLGGAALLAAQGVSSAEELSGRIAAEAQRWMAASMLVPADDPQFIAAPLSDAERKAQKEAGQVVTLDPMRLPFPVAAARFAQQSHRELAGDSQGARWLAGMICQLGREQNADLCELTPLYARTGRQNLHQIYRDYLAAVAGRPDRVLQALTGWVRDPHFLGANLDIRDLRDAAAATSGKPENAAVPGATWLALMSAPFFPLSGDGRHPAAVGWLSRRGGRPRELVWPVWRQPLGRTAIGVLLAHPLVRRAADPRAQRSLAGVDRTAALPQLGVEAVLASSRRTLTNSDGPLQAPELRWPRPAEPSPSRSARTARPAPQG